jgi:hypothetical protein
MPQSVKGRETRRALINALPESLPSQMDVDEPTIGSDEILRPEQQQRPGPQREEDNMADDSQHALDTSVCSY